MPATSALTQSLSTALREAADRLDAIAPAAQALPDAHALDALAIVGEITQECDSTRRLLALNAVTEHGHTRNRAATAARVTHRTVGQWIHAAMTPPGATS